MPARKHKKPNPPKNVEAFSGQSRDSATTLSVLTVAGLFECLQRIETAVEELRREKTVKEWYTTAEVATVLNRAEYTVREWCRLGRIRAKKKRCGRGKGGEWLVSHEELTRLRNEGLLPVQRTV